MTNYLRRCSLTLSGSSIDLGALRVVFKIEANSLQAPNMARFRVYNVSPTTAAALHAKEFSSLTFSAGYEQGDYGVIYSGNVKQAVIGHETAVDSYVDIFCADGDQGYNSAHVNQTLSSGHTPQNIFDAALQSLGKFGITKGQVNVDLSQPKFPRGRPIFEMARDTMRTLAYARNANWSIQNGKLDMIDPTKPLTSSPLYLNSQTGMVGWPKQTGDGIIVTSLLNPNLRPNTLVHIDQSSIIEGEQDNNPLSGPGSQQNFNLANTGLIAADGIYRVFYLDRSGDTRATDWYDVSTCLANGASANAGQQKNYTQPE